MKNKTEKNRIDIHDIFACPIYVTKRDSNLDSTEEEKEIGKIVKEGMTKNSGNSSSNNSYIFNGKLKNIKQYCEQHLKIYVEHVINPKEDLDFYITQSWLNVTKPGECHHVHHHPNSIISGVFYISTEKNDCIGFEEPNIRKHGQIMLPAKENNTWNSINCFFPANNNELILFPSWLLHQVPPNKKATTDRISISFNTFVRGTIGSELNKTELIFK